MVKKNSDKNPMVEFVNLKQIQENNPFSWENPKYSPTTK